MRNKFILTEEEKRSILSMHTKRYISEDDTQPLTVTPTVIKSGVFNQKVLDLQNKLNEKYKSGIVADGKWGTNTANAVSQALSSIPSKPEETPKQEEIPAKMEIKPTNQMKIQTPLQNQTLAQGKPTTVRSAQDIKRGYREDQKLQRQDARQERRDTRQLEKQLKDLQSTYKKLEGKMTPQDKTSYQTQIKQLKDKLSQK